MVCQLQEVPVRAASNRILDNENCSTSTASGLLRGEALPSWEQLQAWPSAPHPSPSHPASLSSDCFVKRVKMTFQEDPKRSFVFYMLFFFFFGLRICFPSSFRSRLSVMEFLPHLIGQTLNLQNSLKAECVFYPEARISGLNWSVSLVMPRLSLFLSLILLLTEALRRSQTLTFCNFTKSFFFFFCFWEVNVLGITSQSSTFMPILFMSFDYLDHKEG